EYCSLVCDQIRWKKVRPVVESEIEGHIEDQRDAYILDGESEEVATEKAILQMGNPVLIGQDFDRTHKPRPQWNMIIMVIGLMLIGIMTNYFMFLSGDSYLGFSIGPYIVAMAIFIVCYYIDFTFLGRFAYLICIVSVLFGVLGGLFGLQILGKLTFGIGRFWFPLAYLGLIYPLVFGLFVYKVRNRGYMGIGLSGGLFIVMLAILLKVPTLTGALIFTIAAVTIPITLVVKNIIKVNTKKTISIIIISVLGIWSLIISYLIKVTGMIREFNGLHYLDKKASSIISQVNFIGKGNIPSDMEATSIFPGGTTDYTLLYIAHEFGLFAMISVIVMFSVFCVFAVYKINKQKNILGKIVALSVVIPFILHAAVYILTNLGYSIENNIAMPFIAYGKLALFINSGLVGFMLSVFRTGYIYGVDSVDTNRKKQLISLSNNKITINLKR
ncbi:MAG: permease prefix domain 1-containing protein, partial [Peptostreptococcaceae bacterium]